ncbi:hypothetical protein XENOCAPTIV_025471 [Xenoophorus captivus]|uniref:Uncharacterized protein n=1 Tax=Xenoophorus captivus TaxID=1517983 RepID=A0ABV0RS51_9TELE
MCYFNMSNLLQTSVVSQINARDASGQTPLHLACERGDLVCVKELLEESQARTDIKDKNGETPMHYASKQDSPVIIQGWTSSTTTGKHRSMWPAVWDGLSPLKPYWRVGRSVMSLAV